MNYHNRPLEMKINKNHTKDKSSTSQSCVLWFSFPLSALALENICLAGSCFWTSTPPLRLCFPPHQSYRAPLVYEFADAFVLDGLDPFVHYPLPQSEWQHLSWTQDALWEEAGCVYLCCGQKWPWDLKFEAARAEDENLGGDKDKKRKSIYFIPAYDNKNLQNKSSDWWYCTTINVFFVDRLLPSKWWIFSPLTSWFQPAAVERGCILYVSPLSVFSEEKKFSHVSEAAISVRQGVTYTFSFWVLMYCYPTVAHIT